MTKEIKVTGLLIKSNDFKLTSTDPRQFTATVGSKTTYHTRLDDAINWIEASIALNSGILDSLEKYVKAYEDAHARVAKMLVENGVK